MSSRKAVLVVDDSKEDILVLKHALHKAGIKAQFHFVCDGQEAVDYLAGEGDFRDRTTHPLPHMMLLDLKMPKMDGFDVLRWMQKHPLLKRLPVTVLTSSDLDRDVDRAYDLGANSYVVKPSSLLGYMEIVETLHKDWTELNRPCSVVVRD